MNEDDKRLIVELAAKSMFYEALSRYAARCADQEWAKVGWVTQKLLAYSLFEDVAKQAAANCRAVLRVLVLSGVRQLARETQ